MKWTIEHEMATLWNEIKLGMMRLHRMMVLLQRIQRILLQALPKVTVRNEMQLLNPLIGLHHHPPFDDQLPCLQLPSQGELVDM